MALSGAGKAMMKRWWEVGAARLEGLVLQGYKNIQGAFPLCQAPFSTLYLVLTVSLGRRQTHYSCFIDEPHL